MKHLIVAMPDGSRWSIPAQPIAEDRARYFQGRYSERHGYSEEGERKAYEDELAYTLSDDEEIIDWAKNNMNWIDLAPHATKLEDAPPINYDRAWPNVPCYVAADYPRHPRGAGRQPKGG